MESLVTASGSDSEGESDNESVYSENSVTWNWRNAENNKKIIEISNILKQQHERLNAIDKKIEELDLRNKPHGGKRTRRRTRGKLRAKSRKKRRRKRRKSRGKSRRRKRYRKKRTRRRK